ncbi:MAG: PHP domain-containing protein [Spirochaetes bacterium]|nr:PHP domain-containing protein [Spirochaetota bacterium]
MIDLHCHTKISDNNFTVEEVINIAYKNGVKYLAITDHDCTFGVSNAVTFGSRYNIDVIPGIEISGYDFKNYKRVHIIGLYVDYLDKSLDNELYSFRLRRHENSYKMYKKLKNLGYEISWRNIKNLAKGGTGVFKQHIVHELMNKGYTDKIFGNLYCKLFAEKDGLVYEGLKYPDVFDAIEMIKKAKGIPVLAHPVVYNTYKIIPELVKKGLKGIEFRHSRQTRQDEAKILSIAKKFDLILTGGSDFHGFYGRKDEIVGNYNPGIKTIELLKKEKNEIHFQKAYKF